MPLIAHYPLNGDTLDHVGNNHAELIDGAGWGDGPVGKSLVTQWRGARLRVPHDDYLSARAFGVLRHVTLAAWIKVNVFENYGLVVGKNADGSYSNSINAIWVNGGGVRFVVGSNIGGNPSRSSSSVTDRNHVKAGRWHHVVGVLDGDRMYLYVDGSITEESNSTLGLERSENTAPISIGGPRVEGWQEGIDGEIQDVRIYDHSLSTKEVRDLYHGKFLDLDVEEIEEPTENLVENPAFHDGIWWRQWGSYVDRYLTGETYRGGKVVRVTQDSKDPDGSTSYGIVSNYVADIAEDEVVTLSLDVRCSHRRALNYAYLMRSGDSNSNFPNVVIDTEWQRVETSLSNSRAATCGVLIGRKTSSEPGEWIEFTNVQLERRSHSTPFTETTRPAAVRNQALTWDPVVADPEPLRMFPEVWEGQTPIGSKALLFDGVNDYLKLDGAPLNGHGDQYTAAMWVYFYSSTLGKDTRFYWHGDDSLILRKGDNDHFIAYLMQEDGAAATQTGGPLIESGRWYHLAAVYTSAELVLYVDGERVAQQPHTGKMRDANSQRVCIGGNGVDQAGRMLMCGIKAYSSALSDADIKSLYQQRASLDEHGSLHTLSLTEGVPYLSPKTAEQNGWPIKSAWGVGVTSSPCSGELTYRQALDFAHAQDGRLPTLAEVEAGLMNGSGCGYDAEYCWTCDEAGEGRHWVSWGNGGGPSHVRDDTSKAVVRLAADVDLDRPDPAKVTDPVTKEWLFS